uniref:Longitudinals lacking protein, isoform G n=1 Tax=Culex pipiens TaxID=7175 RepID=A0A8D7ZXV7_CULPI
MKPNYCFAFYQLSVLQTKQSKEKNRKQTPHYHFSDFCSFAYSFHPPEKEPAEECYPCPRCPRVYRRKITLARHVRHECGVEKNFSCPYCRHVSQRNDQLLGHIRRAHPDIAPYLPVKRYRRDSFL